MGQITAETIACIRRAVDAGQAPPLTLWEFQQLAFLAEKQIANKQAEAPTASNAGEREMLEAELDRRGDDKGQGLDPYWKKAFREGWHTRAALAQVPEQVAGDSITFKQRLDELIEQHGSLRAVGRVLEFDPGYLSRLASGEKSDPGVALLRRMGLREVTSYARAARTSGEANHG